MALRPQRGRHTRCFSASYALDFPICVANGGDPSIAAGRNERYSLLNLMRKSVFAAGVQGYFPDDYEPCADDWVRCHPKMTKGSQTASHVWLFLFL